MSIFKSKKHPYRIVRSLEYFLWLILLFAFVFSIFTLFNAPDQFYQTVFHSPMGHISVMMLIFSLAYFLFLLFSVFFYREWKNFYDDSDLPSCTVLIPAYNEGKHVFKTIISVLESVYPDGKLKIIAINDGSRDDTLFWLRKAEKISGKISIIDLEKNQGKKHALYLGINRADSEVIVTVDSDSVIKRDTLKKIVQPFADDRIGAVAGIITGKKKSLCFHVKLLDVMLIFGCEFLRRAQSITGNVFCTPGALSAYRKSAVVPVIDEWLQQEFCGSPARIGEDRAIATLLLREGHRIVHQNQALAETCLPVTYCGVCKMLLRWVRSDIRENILMMPFVLKNLSHPSRRSLNLFIHWLMLSLNMYLPLLFFPVGIYCLCITGEITCNFAIIFLSAVLWSIIPAIVYYRWKRSLRESVWAFLFGFYSLLCLSWINIWAVFTINNSNWLTREIKSKLPSADTR